MARKRAGKKKHDWEKTADEIIGPRLRAKRVKLSKNKVKPTPIE